MRATLMEEFKQIIGELFNTVQLCLPWRHSLRERHSFLGCQEADVHLGCYLTASFFQQHGHWLLPIRGFWFWKSKMQEGELFKSLCVRGYFSPSPCGWFHVKWAYLGIPGIRISNLFPKTPRRSRDLFSRTASMDAHLYWVSHPWRSCPWGQVLCGWRRSPRAPRGRGRARCRWRWGSWSGSAGWGWRRAWGWGCAAACAPSASPRPSWVAAETAQNHQREVTDICTFVTEPAHSNSWQCRSIKLRAEDGNEWRGAWSSSVLYPCYLKPLDGLLMGQSLQRLSVNFQDFIPW